MTCFTSYGFIAKSLRALQPLHHRDNRFESCSSQKNNTFQDSLSQLPKLCMLWKWSWKMLFFPCNKLSLSNCMPQKMALIDPLKLNCSPMISSSSSSSSSSSFYLFCPYNYNMFPQPADRKLFEAGEEKEK